MTGTSCTAVATAVVEVRSGAVVSYPASYDDYVYRTRKELEEGLRAEHTTRGTPEGGTSAGSPKLGGREERDLQKKLKATERKIAKLDDEKKTVNSQQSNVTDAKEAQKLHKQLATLASEVEQLEEEWLEIYNELEGVS